MKDDSNVCPNCGADFDEVEGEAKEIYSETVKDDSSSYSYGGGYASGNGVGLSTGIKALLVILTLFMPFVGLIGGIILMVEGNGNNRAFGKTLLIIAISLFAVGAICMCFGRMLLGTAFLFNY